MPRLDPTKIALVHVAKKQVGMADDSYRALLRDVGGVESSKALDEAAFLLVMQRFELLGFSRRPMVVKSPTRQPPKDHVSARPGLWQERGGLKGLVVLDVPAVTAGMIVVAKQATRWQTNPALRWQVWPEDLEAMPLSDEPASRPGMASNSQVTYIRAMWESWQGQSDERALSRWLEKRYGISALRFADVVVAQKAIQGLKAMLARKAQHNDKPAPVRGYE